MSRVTLDPSGPGRTRIRVSLPDAALTVRRMSVTIELPADAQARLEAEAAQRGMTLDQLIADMAASLPSGSGDEHRPEFTFLAAGASKSGITHQIDELLADGFGRS